MTRIKKKTQLKIEIAAEKAKKEIYQEAKIKKKRKKRKIKEINSALTEHSIKWVEDPLGNQDKVFFDGYKYWLTIVPPKSKGDKIENVSFMGLTPEQWEERNKREEEHG